ncbi:MAG: type II toxin-antitoxin system VapB family antitoxin [Burkholderiales bacterium]
MKTTIEIADALLTEAKRIAHREGTTVKALVEQGLRRELSEHRRRVGFRLRRATVKGNGLQPGASGRSWSDLRDLAYEDRGA